MLFTEFNLEEAKEVWREEAIEEGMAKGIEQGISIGKLEVALAMFADGFSLEKIAHITKLPMKTLKTKLV